MSFDDRDVDDHTPALQAQQVELVYSQGAISLLGAGIVLLFTVFLLHRAVPPALLSGWAASITAAYLARYLLIRRYRRTAVAKKSNPGYWRRVHLTATAVTGAMWGAGGVVLFPEQAIPHQAILLLAIGGLSAAVTVPSASLRWVGPTFSLSAIVPFGLALIANGDPVAVSTGVLALVYVSILVVAQLHANDVTTSGLRLGLENAELAERYRRSTERLETMNRDLITEVEERRSAERRLRESEQKLRRAQRIAGFGNWEWDAETGRIEWSEQVYRIFHREPGPPLDFDSVLAQVHPEDRQLILDTMERARAGHGQFAIDYRLQLPDGTLRWVHDEGEGVYREGELVHMTGVLHDITRRVEAEEQTRATAEEMSRIFANMQDTYYRTDVDGTLLRVSDSTRQLVGYPPEQCVGRNMAEFYANPAARKRFLKDLHANGGVVHGYHTLLRHRDGSDVWVSTNAQVIRDEAGNTIGLEGTTRNITALKKAQSALAHQQASALATLQAIRDGVITLDRRGRIDYLNPIAERLTGVRAAEAIGLDCCDVVRVFDQGTGESLDQLVRLCLSAEATDLHADDSILQSAGGVTYAVKVTASPMRDPSAGTIGAVLVLHDVTELQGLERQLSYNATHDALTGLLNRAEFERRVMRAVQRARTGVESALLFMDLDQFKVINDTCGHRAGDQLIEQLAVLLERMVDDDDALSRLGGDEFGILMENCAIECAESRAEAIRKAIREFRFSWDGKNFDVGISIGLVPLDRSSTNAVEVMSAADTACFVAKESGRNRVHIYQSDDGAVARHHGEMQWVHRISAAFEANRFVLHAQAIAGLEADELPVAHYEVLIRMLDEDGAMVPPMAFIPAAERYNLMPTIDRWVLRTTLGMLREAQGPADAPPVRCAVNLSGQSLCDDHFLEFAIEQFEQTGVPFSSICFEVTETAAIANLGRAIRLMSQLRERGASFALDDFGSGLSSFGYLKNLTVDYLKIDGAFIKDLLEDEMDRAMVESINRVGHVMGLKTVAEFVENDALIAELRRLGIDFGQGYGVHRPEPLAAVLDRIGTAVRSGKRA